MVSDIILKGQLTVTTRSGSDGILITIVYPSRHFNKHVLAQLTDPAYALQGHEPGPWLALCVYHADRVNGWIRADETETGLELTVHLPYRIGRSSCPPPRHFKGTMIRTQDLAYAIENISRQDPEIGYALSELLAAGHIRIPLDAGNPEKTLFLFDQERVFIRKVSFSITEFPRLKKDWSLNTEKQQKNTELMDSPLLRAILQQPGRFTWLASPV